MNIRFAELWLTRLKYNYVFTGVIKHERRWNNKSDIISWTVCGRTPRAHSCSRRDCYFVVDEYYRMTLPWNRRDKTTKYTRNTKNRLDHSRGSNATPSPRKTLTRGKRRFALISSACTAGALSLYAIIAVHPYAVCTGTIVYTHTHTYPQWKYAPYALGYQVLTRETVARGSARYAYRGPARAGETWKNRYHLNYCRTGINLPRRAVAASAASFCRFPRFFLMCRRRRGRPDIFQSFRLGTNKKKNVFTKKRTTRVHTKRYLRV